MKKRMLALLLAVALVIAAALAEESFEPAADPETQPDAVVTELAEPNLLSLEPQPLSELAPEDVPLETVPEPTLTPAPTDAPQ